MYPIKQWKMDFSLFRFPDHHMSQCFLCMFIPPDLTEKCQVISGFGAVYRIYGALVEQWFNIFAETALEKESEIEFFFGYLSYVIYMGCNWEGHTREKEPLGRALKTNTLLYCLPSKFCVYFLGQADNVRNHRNDSNIVIIVGEEENALVV